VRVRQVCDKYDLPYTTGSFMMQHGKAWRIIAKLSLPDRYLRDTADDAPETRSERMFSQLEPGFAGTDLATGAAAGSRRQSPRFANGVATCASAKTQSRAAPIMPQGHCFTGQ